MSKLFTSIFLQHIPRLHETWVCEVQTTVIGQGIWNVCPNMYVTSLDQVWWYAWFSPDLFFADRAYDAETGLGQWDCIIASSSHTLYINCFWEALEGATSDQLGKETTKPTCSFHFTLTNILTPKSFIAYCFSVTSLLGDKEFEIPPCLWCNILVDLLFLLGY